MKIFDIRIENLPPMMVAHFRAFSQHPEIESSETLWAWSQQVGINLEDVTVRRVVEPNPPPWDTSDLAYGYESWVTITPHVNPCVEIRVKKFTGSLCAITSIEKLADIGAAWEYLYQWVRHSEDYEHAHMDGLEEVLSPAGTPEEQLSFNLWGRSRISKLVFTR